RPRGAPACDGWIPASNGAGGPVVHEPPGPPDARRARARAMGRHHAAHRRRSTRGGARARDLGRAARTDWQRRRRRGRRRRDSADAYDPSWIFSGAISRAVTLAPAPSRTSLPLVASTTPVPPPAPIAAPFAAPLAPPAIAPTAAPMPAPI